MFFNVERSSRVIASGLITIHDIKGGYFQGKGTCEKIIG